MSNKHKRAIETAIQKLAGTFKGDPVRLFPATVISYDENAATCVVSGPQDVTIPDVQLQAGICDGLLILPSPDSTVMVLKSTYNDYLVIQFSDIDKVYLQVGKSRFVLFNAAQDDGSIMQLNDGSFGGLIKITNLVTKINALENAVTGLAAYVGGLPIPVTGAVSGPPVPANTQPFEINPVTQRADIENSLITHGK